VEGYIKTEDEKAPSITDAIEAKATEAIEKVVPKVSVDNPHYEVLAVTGCPTGIAHTYMAAESLERKAKEMGISLKVEKNGASGIKDALTAEEIEHAKCIIVASDRQVEMARFDGKPMIQTKVANGINKAEELLREAMSGAAPVYHASQSDKDSAEISGEDAKLFLKRIGMIIAKMPNEVKTDIIGYTDNTNPSKDSIYKNNWQLSTARALSVLEELVSDGVPQERLITSGRASFDPIASNSTDEGRAKNNRVEIHFVSLEPKNKEATKKSILDTRN